MTKTTQSTGPNNNDRGLVTPMQLQILQNQGFSLGMINSLIQTTRLTSLRFVVFDNSANMNTLGKLLFVLSIIIKKDVYLYFSHIRSFFPFYKYQHLIIRCGYPLRTLNKPTTYQLFSTFSDNNKTASKMLKPSGNDGFNIINCSRLEEIQVRFVSSFPFMQFLTCV